MLELLQVHKLLYHRLIDLVPSTQANAFSLSNLPAGVYTLDVITQKGNTKAAYEGILVISQQITIVIHKLRDKSKHRS